MIGMERHLELFRLKALITLARVARNEGRILTPEERALLCRREQRYTDLRARELYYEAHGIECNETETFDLEHDAQREIDLIDGTWAEQMAASDPISKF